LWCLARQHDETFHPTSNSIRNDVVSYAKAEDVKAVFEHRLITRIGMVDDGALSGITWVLKFLLHF
jgi:hypothetical protein